LNVQGHILENVNVQKFLLMKAYLCVWIVKLRNVFNALKKNSREIIDKKVMIHHSQAREKAYKNKTIKNKILLLQIKKLVKMSLIGNQMLPYYQKKKIHKEHLIAQSKSKIGHQAKNK